MNKVKFTVEIPADNYCGECPCLGLNGKEEEHCGYFNKPLNCKGLKVIKCGECKLMTRMLIAEIEALQQENEQLKAELSQWSYLGDIATTELIAERLYYIPTLKHENEQLRAQVARMRELLVKAYDEIEKYKCLWKGSKPSGCDCPKPTTLQDEIEQTLAEIDKAIGGKEDV